MQEVTSLIYCDCDMCKEHHFHNLNSFQYQPFVVFPGGKSYCLSHIPRDKFKLFYNNMSIELLEYMIIEYRNNEYLSPQDRERLFGEKNIKGV